MNTLPVPCPSLSLPTMAPAGRITRLQLRAQRHAEAMRRARCTSQPQAEHGAIDPQQRGLISLRCRPTRGGCEHSRLPEWGWCTIDIMTC